MAIKPKYSIEDPRHIASREFTDREEFFVTFNRVRDNLTADKHSLLVFYGVGGIGKSSLRRELIKRMSESPKKAIPLVIDFEIPTFREQDTALFHLRRSLIQAAKAQFPTFDLAYAIYWQKIRPQTSISKDNLSIVEDSDNLAEILGAFEVLPMVGLIPKVAKLFISTKSYLQEWWIKTGQESLARIPEMEPQEIAKRLPGFFANDLKAFLTREKQTVVFFLDTYEALWESERKENTFFLRDEWIRELVAHLPGLLWVFCGREKLRWDEVDSDWGEVLEQHLIGGLSDNDARRFLLGCGIKSELILDVMIENSQGLPYYLDLQVDLFLEILNGKERVPEVADFVGTPREVAERLLKYLDRSEHETLKVLACAEFWNEDLFSSLVSHFQTMFPPSNYAELCRFSFINSCMHPDTFTMHKIVAECLKEITGKDFFHRVNSFLIDFYLAKFDGISFGKILQIHRDSINPLAHALANKQDVEWTRFMEICSIFEESHEWQSLIPTYLFLYDKFEDKQKAFWAEKLGWILHLVGQFAKSDQFLTDAIDLNKRLFGEEDERTSQSLYLLAESKTNQEKYSEAEVLHRKVLSIRKNLFGQNHRLVGNSLSSLARTVKLLKNAHEAIPLYQEALAIKKNLYGEKSNQVADQYSLLGSCFRLAGKSIEAARFNRKSLAIKQEIYGPIHLEVADSQIDLAFGLVNLGDFAQAEELARNALEIAKKLLPNKSSLEADFMAEVSLILRMSQKYLDAEVIAREALSVRKYIFGEVHQDVAESLKDLASIASCLERFQEAETMFLEALQIATELFGPESPSVAENLDSLADCFKSQDKLLEAEKAIRKALKIRKKVFGPAHRLVVATLSNLDDILIKQLKIAEAEILWTESMKSIRDACKQDDSTLAKQMWLFGQSLSIFFRNELAEIFFRESLEIRKGVFGFNSQEVVESLESLAVTCLYLQKMDKAEAYFREALEVKKVLHGFYHIEVVKTLRQLANVLEKQGKFIEYEVVQGNILKMIISLPGIDDLEIANALNCYSWALVCLERFEEAEKFATNAVEKFQKSNLANSLDYFCALDTLGRIFKAKQQFSEAEACFKETTAHYSKQLLGLYEDDLLESLNLLGSVLIMQGKEQEYQELCLKYPLLLK